MLADEKLKSQMIPKDGFSHFWALLLADVCSTVHFYQLFGFNKLLVLQNELHFCPTGGSGGVSAIFVSLTSPSTRRVNHSGSAGVATVMMLRRVTAASTPMLHSGHVDEMKTKLKSVMLRSAQLSVWTKRRMMMVVFE